MRKSGLRKGLIVLGSLGALLTLGLGFIYWYDKTGQRPDPAFDSSVANPGYASEHPRVVFDIAHRNWHTPDGRYRPLADLLRHDGYTIAANDAPFSAARLAAARCLVVANAMGPDGYEGRPAFTEEEETALAEWVRQGGALLLIADHAPFGGAAARLAERFGVTMHLTFARDDRNSDGDDERLVFSRANGLLGDHPITRGRDAAERVSTVTTFTGQSLSIPPGATALLRMSDQSYDWESRKVRRSARGHAQGIAMPFGAGRVVILGEAGLLSAQVDPLGFKMGMNRAGNDDRQLALNIFHWLTGLLR
jgi:hypothetical protein